MDEVAVVTGASRGIGAAAAVGLGKLGYRVVVNYFSRQDAAEQVVSAVCEAGGDGVAVAGDMRVPADAARVVGAATERFGRLDALVCNAATPVKFTPFTELDFTELDFAELAEKVTGELAAAFHPARAAVPVLTAGGGGRMVFVSSDMARASKVPAGIGHGTAKAALDTFARYLAAECGPAGIAVNVLSPGYTRTANFAANAATELAAFERQLVERTPLRRIAEPVDVGRVIARLAADTGGFVTGTIIPVTGGAEITR